MVAPKYDFNYIRSEFNKLDEFKTESDMCDYIDINMEKFITDIMGIDYKEHERESYIVPFKSFGANKARIDFMVTNNNGEKILIEVKNLEMLQQK